jgi:hypothetical protein
MIPPTATLRAGCPQVPRRRLDQAQSHAWALFWNALPRLPFLLPHDKSYLGFQAVRVLAPGGSLVLYEPSSSWFNRLAHRLLDPIVFRAAQQYESPIDIRYKNAFQQRVIVEELQRLGLEMPTGTSDFLAYPFTGCYAGSVFLAVNGSCAR